MLRPYDYHSNRGACIATIIVPLDHQPTTLNLLLNGGPYFAQAADYQQTNVLACYQLAHQQTVPAILSIQYGHGHVILSGVHLEYSPQWVEEQRDPYLAKLLPTLVASEHDRLRLVRQLLQRLQLAMQ